MVTEPWAVCPPNQGGAGDFSLGPEALAEIQRTQPLGWMFVLTRVEEPQIMIKSTDPLQDTISNESLAVSDTRHQSDEVTVRVGSVTASSVTPRMIGPYALEEEIGRGAMGTVHRATHTKLKRRVAVKLLPRMLSSQRPRLARFVREMHRPSRCVRDHPAGSLGASAHPRARIGTPRYQAIEPHALETGSR